ncbi:MAG: 5'/3'-nucleotidase SurE [Flexilinea sp.]
MDKPQIVLTNDDGIDSPGLWAMAEKLAPLGELWVVAPNVQYSGSGRCFFRESDGIIEERESKIKGLNIRAFAIGGSPAQSVFHAVKEILPVPPVLVVSGINYGENLGNIVTSSGTVGAAIEAGGLGIKSIAISLEITPEEGYLSYSESVNFDIAAKFGQRFAKMIILNGLPDGVDILKIDVPKNATLSTPWRLTRISRISEMNKRINRIDFSQPAPIDWLPEFDQNLIEPDSDIQAVCHESIVSVSPMTIDMTAKNDFSTIMTYLQ